jgi:hypothetical protein
MVHSKQAVHMCLKPGTVAVQPALLPFTDTCFWLLFAGGRQRSPPTCARRHSTGDAAALSFDSLQEPGRLAGHTL